ncbi:hypothetical protein GCM10027289_25030 [Tsukamurella serpentis]
MTGYSTRGRTLSPLAGRARRVRTLTGRRQTRLDVVVSTALLVISLTATIANFALTIAAMPSFRQCAAMACSFVGLDVLAITAIISLLLGTTFGAHAVLNLLNRRTAWVHALLDAVVSLACLFGGLAWITTA